MKPGALASAVIWVVVASGLLLAWHFGKERASAESAIGGLRRELASLADRRASLRDKLAKAEASQQQLKSKSAGAAAKHPAKGGARGEWLDQLRTDPKVQLRYFAYERSHLNMKYAPLFQKLGLSPAQISKCEDNLIRHEEDQMDLMNTFQDEGLTLSDPVAGALFGRESTEYQTAQQAVLGQDGFAQLNTYETQLSPRLAVNDYAGAATMAGIPLTTAQLQQLTALAVQDASLSGGPAPVDAYTNSWARIDSQARAFLTPDQLNLMQTQEFLGPFGEGTRYQLRLNTVISLADQADIKASSSSGGTGP
jgi:hypothetical protein